MLRLVSYFCWKIHLSIFLLKISTWAKWPFAGVNVVRTSLIHAYKIQPYSRTLRTNALTNNNLTLTFVIPTILQLVHIDMKLRFAAFKRAFKI